MLNNSTSTVQRDFIVIAQLWHCHKNTPSPILLRDCTRDIS